MTQQRAEEMSSEREELLPCPFCGGECAEVELVNEEYQWKRVLCWDCDATSRPRPTEAEAIAAWNRRAASLLHLPAETGAWTLEQIDVALYAAHREWDARNMASLSSLLEKHLRRPSEEQSE